MVDRTKQPAVCIGISEKCVFTLKRSLLSRYREQLTSKILEISFSTFLDWFTAF